MRFTFAESMCDPEQYAPLARAAERAGFDSFTVPDSVCFTERSDSSYPYTDDGDRGFLADRPFLDPFALIAALGAVTSRLRFTTFVVKLPIRHPVLVAKQVASLAVLTGNRLGFGVGLSPWPEDFAVTGTDWKTRGRRMDEMIEIIRGLMRGEFFAYAGAYYDLPSLRINPVPSRPVPILIGGHSDGALRRAARLGDGWMHAGGGKASDLDGALARLRVLRREHGREREPFEVHVISLDAYTPDGVRRLEDKGVTDAIVGFRNVYEKDSMTLAQKIEALERYAEQVISRVR